MGELHDLWSWTGTIKFDLSLGQKSAMDIEGTHPRRGRDDSSTLSRTRYS
jgi:hypothetical protein